MVQCKTRCCHNIVCLVWAPASSLTVMVGVQGPSLFTREPSLTECHHRCNSQPWCRPAHSYKCIGRPAACNQRPADTKCAGNCHGTLVERVEKRQDNLDKTRRSGNTTRNGPVRPIWTEAHWTNLSQRCHGDACHRSGRRGEVRNSIQYFLYDYKATLAYLTQPKVHFHAAQRRSARLDTGGYMDMP